MFWSNFDRVLDRVLNMKNLEKFTFCTGTHIRFIEKGGTKSEVYDQEKKAKATPFGHFFKNLIFKKNHQKLIFFKN